MQGLSTATTKEAKKIKAERCEAGIVDRW